MNAKINFGDVSALVWDLKMIKDGVEVSLEQSAGRPTTGEAFGNLCLANNRGPASATEKRNRSKSSEGQVGAGSEKAPPCQRGQSEAGPSKGELRRELENLLAEIISVEENLSQIQLAYVAGELALDWSKKTDQPLDLASEEICGLLSAINLVILHLSEHPQQSRAFQVENAHNLQYLRQKKRNLLAALDGKPHFPPRNDWRCGLNIA